MWDTLGPQYQWLEQDLQQNKSMWKIVYFHHPPFTMGSHNSDTESDLVIIRKNIARLLEKYGVDLVLNGHSHNYERSWLQKGHYGLEATFNKTIHTLDSSTARYDGSFNSCPYKKDTADNMGTVYVIAGEAGKLGATQSTYPHDSKCFSDSYRAGAFFLEIEGNRLDAFYLEEDSLIHDKFTILKNVNRHQSITVFSNQTAVISASWNGTYNWNFNNSHLKSQTVTPAVSSQYIVNDSLNCLADTFSLVIPGVAEKELNSRLNIFPNPTKEKLFLSFMNINQEVEYEITSVSGQLIYSSKALFLKGKAEVNIPGTLSENHTYLIILKISEKQVAKPFFIDR
jgi:acid phosphatase type 7